MFDRKFRLPEAKVQSGIDAFKNEGGVAAEDLVELLKTKTLENPGLGKKVPDRPGIWKESAGQKLSGERLFAVVLYKFDRKSVKWTFFKGWVFPDK